ncbi:MAG TPA: hypothetical protein VIF09_18820 [Polyangiaceae bacterium]
MRANILAKAVLGYVPGIQKHYSNATLHLAGADVTATALVGLFQGLGSAVAAVAAAEQQRADAVKAAAAELAKVQPVAKAFRQTVMAAFAGQAAILADFSLEPAKKPVISAAAKAAAAEKAAATRKALGTRGSQQKKTAKKQLAAGAAASSPAASASAPVEGAPTPASPPPAAPPQAPAKS